MWAVQPAPDLHSDYLPQPAVATRRRCSGNRRRGEPLTPRGLPLAATLLAAEQVDWVAIGAGKPSAVSSEVEPVRTLGLCLDIYPAAGSHLPATAARCVTAVQGVWLHKLDAPILIQGLAIPHVGTVTQRPCQNANQPAVGTVAPESAGAGRPRASRDRPAAQAARRQCSLG
jgi:hypothetical protein